MSDLVHNQFSFGALAQASGYNKHLTADSFPKALNDTDSAASGLTLSILSGSPTAANLAYAGADKHGIPAVVISGIWSTTSSYVLRLNGTMPSGKRIKSITLGGAAAQNVNDVDRVTTYTVGALAPVNHNARNYMDNAPVTVTVGSAALPLDIAVAKASGAIAGYLSVMNIEFEADATAPSITDVDTDNDVTAGQTGVSVNGTSFGASQGSGTVTITSPSALTTIAQTVTSWSDTAVEITVVNINGDNALPYGASQTLTLTDDNAASDTYTITLSPPDGTTVVDVVSPDTTSASLFQDTTPAVADGDQVWYEVISGTSVVVNANGTLTSDSATAEITFRIWDATDETISAEYTATLQDGVVSVGGGRKQFRISFGMGF